MAYYYIDRKTGKRVAASKWVRSKRQGGTRYVRRITKQTPAKSNKGTKEKRTQTPEKTPKKAAAKDSGNIQHILTVAVASPRRSSRTGRMVNRQFKRDIVIPGPRGATQKQLIKIARDTLPAGEQYVVGWLKQPGKKITIAEGPRSSAKKAKLR